MAYSKSKIEKNLPSCFTNYKETRVILDCFETTIEKPKCLNCRIRTYSHYKGNNTIKMMGGILLQMTIMLFYVFGCLVIVFPPYQMSLHVIIVVLLYISVTHFLIFFPLHLPLLFVNYCSLPLRHYFFLLL